MGFRRPLFSIRGLVEGFFSHPEGVHRRRHAAVEDHLGDDLRYLFPCDADVQRAGDVPLNHLRAVPQHYERCDGAEAAGLQVDGGAVVYLAVYDLVHQAHNLRRQLGHGCRWDRIVLGPVVALPEVEGGLVQVFACVFGLFVRAHGISRWDAAAETATR